MLKRFLVTAASVLILAGCGDATTTTDTTTEPAPGTTTEAAETEEPAPEEMKVTLAQFEQLETGMTLAEVEAIIGPGEELSRTEIEGAPVTAMYMWEGSGDFGSNMNAMFQDGALISKSQLGLK